MSDDAPILPGLCDSGPERSAPLDDALDARVEH